MRTECQSEAGHVGADPAEPEQTERRAGEVNADSVQPPPAGANRNSFGHQIP